jgi:pyruvate formate lyase activating enzyme
MKSPLVFEITSNVLDDGPGIRSVIFFKGCPLACVWCQNPEGMRPGVEIAFAAGRCIQCDSCLAACAPGALSRAEPAFLDREACTLCFACLEVCPSGALSRVGEALAPEAIVARVLRDKPFHEVSGGGVTLSGGEPTLHLDYLSQVLRGLKEQGIGCLLETCGHFDFDRFMSLAYPHLDVIYFDLKVLDAEAHRHYCGVSNRVILENFRQLVPRARADGKLLLPRVPLVPGITEQNLQAIAAFLRGQQVSRAKLLPYNPLWPDKSATIGRPAQRLDAAWREWMPRSVLEACAVVFQREGIKVSERTR